MGHPGRVLKFARSDDDSQYVLLYVDPNGPNPLDVKIQATEGEAEYGATCEHRSHCQVRQNAIDSLMVKNCPVSAPEWQQIVENLFRQEQPADIQAVATVTPDSSMSIVVRRSTRGVIQRLGSFTLPAVPGGELNVLDWCATAVDAAAESKHAAMEETQRVRQMETEVANLKRQLEELIQAKDEDETALFLKFRDLLNEKKVKIREQQKIIASTNAAGVHGDEKSESPSEAPASQTALPERSRKAGRSRDAKRKAAATPVPDEEEVEESPEPMDVEKVKSEPEETDSGGETEATESADSSEEDPEGEEEAPGKTIDRGPSTPSAKRPEPPKKASAQPPAKRSLPFVKSKSKPQAAPRPITAGADDDTDSDDEL
ncbi:DNA double-strand break repair and V(D)J recombination protein XRCC4 [Geosmithia morbida]|uniref:DNA double-strand break repair and V(D)J recombination protein XRCC4 n=1 Tax=Geosmithia morbida TaxID=1094350 RepID=A0A9P4Z0G4_9HYPO|nr:DNA double-strand break repair and V(D)J recombination protein XRCC4 [Geosmithia morbida]KAF4126428.1 DNA double-strand break repair and V(D)J recombination protein XRCC4 [Geosmithia morbida]